MAVTQLRLREIRITEYRVLQYSPVGSSEVPMAAKARIAIMVAPPSGMAI